jgi:hypothetical protein
VVDWFLPIGKWLHENRPRLFPASLEVIDYCESIKVEILHTWTATHIGMPQFNELLLLHLGSETETTYVRRRYKPDVRTVGSSVRSPLLSFRQLTTSTALAAQRLPRTGSIGDDFEAVDFAHESFPLGSQEAQQQQFANQHFARSMRERKAAANGGNPNLWKFEGASSAHPKSPFAYQGRAKGAKPVSVLGYLTQSIKDAGVKDNPVVELTLREFDAAERLRRKMSYPADLAKDINVQEPLAREAIPYHKRPLKNIGRPHTF